MTNELTKTSNTDNFTAAAAHAQSSTIVGDRVRFSKGRYLVGRGDMEELRPGSTFEVVDVQCAWVRFEGGQVTDTRVGWPMAPRDELGDTEEEDWPIGFDGQPSDPWSNQRYLLLIEPKTGRELTFVTSSFFGRAAVETLAGQVATKRRSFPGAVALVKLEPSYKNSKSYGAIPAPKFNIVGWNGVEQAPTAIPVTGRRDDLDDEIPF